MRAWIARREVLEHFSSCWVNATSGLIARTSSRNRFMRSLIFADFNENLFL